MKTLLGWLAVFVAVGTSGVQAGTLIGRESEWRYWPGNEAPSEPERAWTGTAFSDQSWSVGTTPFRYGDGQGGTLITGMRHNFSTFFIRREFRVASVELVEGLELNMDYDDGFAVWINGVEVLRVNAPESLALDGLAPAGHESGSVETFSLDSSLRHLVDGKNVMAIQGFNTNLPSSDFVLHPELLFRGLDLEAPTVASVDPPPGAVGDFRVVTVTFSEPVRGVQASDLSVNGVSAVRVRGNGATYQFTFAEPDSGELTLRWNQDADIEDLAARPNPFDWQAASETRTYFLIDADAPFVTSVFPRPRQRLREFSEVEIVFSEAVVGVDADDLKVNGTPADRVDGAGAGPYRFTFPVQSAGPAILEWGPNNGIEDSASEPNELQGNSWQYTVDPDVAYEGVEISEIMAGNRSGILDDERERVDWIELHNTNSETIDLSGWSLSDDSNDPGKWVIEDFRIAANDFVIVFASAKNRANRRAGQSPHTNFRLSRAGEFLGLYSPELPRRLVSDLGDRYPEQRNDHSYGRLPDGGLSYFASPTPRAVNDGEAVTQILPKPRFSAPRGFYDRPFHLSLSSPVDGAVVRYTLDSSEPTLENGEDFVEPIMVGRARTVRAAAFKPGFLPSETVTHSYLYRLSNSRRSLPVLSLVTDRDHLFGPRGIMETRPRNTSKRGRSWERPVSVEYFNPDGSTGFQIDCGLRIQGGNYVRGRYSPSGGLPFSKYSYRLYFRGDYGEPELTFPLIPRSPADFYKQVVLRAGMNDHSNPFVVDELVRRLSADMGQVSSQGTLVSLYVNGAYKGYYNPTERIDEDFLDTWQGGNGDYDIIAQFGEVRAGDTVEWEKLKAAMRRDLSRPSNYEEASQLLNIDSFIDYLILNIYVGTRDWPHNNWRAARERVEGAQWRFYVWDAEWAFFNQGGSVSHNTLTSELSVNQDIARFYRALAKNSDFRARFADRVHRHFFGEGALTDENVSRRFEELRGAMSQVLRNMNRNILTSWIPRRREIVFGHLAKAGLFLEDNVPKFSHSPGGVRVPSIGLESGDGAIYYTLDGSDPFISATASNERRELVRDRSTKYVLVPTDASVASNWRREGSSFDSSAWRGGRGGVGYDEAQTYRTHIRIDVGDEMNDKNTSVYVRIPFNLRLDQVDGMNLMNLRMKYDDGFVAYLNGVRVASANAPNTLRWNSSASGDHPDTAAVVFQDFDISEHISRLREGSNVLAFQGLNAQLTSSDFLLDAILEVGTVNPGQIADSAILYEDEIAINGPTRIRARSFAKGLWSAASEGLFYPGGLTATVGFSEIMYHPPGGDEFEFLELTNFGPVTFDLSQYSFDGVSFEFPFGSFLDPGQSLVLASDQKPSAFTQRYPSVSVWGHFGGSLSNAGEPLSLRDPEGRFVAGVHFKDDGVWPVGADGGGFSLERVALEEDGADPTQWQQSPTRGGSPGRVQSIPSDGGLMISELMAANQSAVEMPTGRFPDWIELWNAGPTRVHLAGYRLKDESANEGFVFGEEVFLDAGERLVVWQSSAGGSGGGLPFGLDRSGDSVVLLDAEGRRVDGVRFGRQLVDHSLIQDRSGAWTLGLPSPGLVNRTAPVGSLESLRINELVANPLPGDSDWLELTNADRERALSLNGLHFQMDGHIVRFNENSFIGPGAHEVYVSDGMIEHDSLTFKLPAVGGELKLLSEDGDVIDQVVYGPQTEATSLGRLPDGTGSFQVFTVNASPGLENYQPLDLVLRINELMARNQTRRYDGIPGTPDWVEIENRSTNPMDLGGIRLRISDGEEWAFPVGTQIAASGFLVLWFDSEMRSAPGDHLDLFFNRSLGGGSGFVELSDQQGRLLDRVVYGPQIPDRSLGWTGSEWELLSESSPGEANGPGALLGAVSELVINEWRGGGSGDDWLELYNRSDLPVALDGLYVSDDPSLFGKTKHEIGPMSFVDGGAWVTFRADGEPQRGADHLSFRLDQQGETLRLYSKRLEIIDEVTLAVTGAQSGSEGRMPDGAERIASFGAHEQSPGGPNSQVIPGLLVSEVLTHAEAPLEPAIEFYNRSNLRFDLSGWHLGWSALSLDQYKIPEGFVLQPGAFSVIYEADWLSAAGFGLAGPSPADARDLYLSEVDSMGNHTGRRLRVPIQPAMPGQSLGTIDVVQGPDFGRLVRPTFGAGSPTSLEQFRSGVGGGNSAPWVGPVVIREILYVDGESGGGGDPRLGRIEFLHLFNRSDQRVELASRSDASIGWRIGGGVDYTFEGDLRLDPGESVVVVNFDPEADVSRGRAFREAFSLPQGTLLVGPFLGRLGNEGDRLRIERLAEISNETAGNLTGLRWLEEDRVHYQVSVPWPEPASGAWQVLSRIDPAHYGNDPGNWERRDLKPGRGEGGSLTPSMRIVQGLSFSNGRVMLRLLPESGRRYRVEYTDRLGAGLWRVLMSITGEGNEVELVDPGASGSQRYYRVISE